MIGSRSRRPPRRLAKGAVDVDSFLSSKSPVTLKKSAQVRIGDSFHRLSEHLPKQQGTSALKTWGSVSLRPTVGKPGTTTHGIGTEICYLDVSPVNGLLPMVGVYRLADVSSNRWEGAPASFLTGMVRMLPIEIRYPKEGEVVEEFAVPISTVAKLAGGDPEMQGILTGEDESNRITVSTHGLEFSFSYLIEANGQARLSEYRYLLSQITEREELPGLALDAGKPTVVVDGGTVDVDFSPEEMVVIHLTSAQERSGGNPLLLVLTIEGLDSNSLKDAWARASAAPHNWRAASDCNAVSKV